MSKRGGMSRGGGPKAPPRSPMPATSSPAVAVGTSSFTDSGVSQALQNNFADANNNSTAANTRTTTEPPKHFDKFDGGVALERLYRGKEEAEQVEYCGEMFSPIGDKEKEALIKKINAIATGGK